MNIGYGAGNYDPRYYVLKGIGEFLKMGDEDLKKRFSHLSSKLANEAISYIKDC